MPPKNDTNKETQARCVWTDADDAILVRVLKGEKDAGNSSGAGWKQKVWTVVETALRNEGIAKGGVKTAAKCSDHLSNLKKQFLVVYALRNASGFGWDDGTKKVLASDSVWDAYIKSHPSAKQWRNTPFPLYDEMHYLVNGVVATGADAFHPGESPAPSSVIDTEEARSTVSDVGGATDNTEPETLASSSTILDDALAGEIMDDESQSTEASASTKSATKSRKRTRAPTDSPSPPKSSKKRRHGGRRHASQADSISGVGDAISQMAAALNAVAATPVRRKKAVDLVAQDDEYSDDEHDKIMDLFSDHMTIADMYTSIINKERRVRYIRGRISRVAELSLQ